MKHFKPKAWVLPQTVLIIGTYNADGTPNTAHSLNPVPCVYVTEDKNAKVENGILADVAPTILHIMGIPQPKEMTGHNLIEG